MPKDVRTKTGIMRMVARYLVDGSSEDDVFDAIARAYLDCTLEDIDPAVRDRWLDAARGVRNAYLVTIDHLKGKRACTT